MPAGCSATNARAGCARQRCGDRRAAELGDTCLTLPASPAHTIAFDVQCALPRAIAMAATIRSSGVDLAVRR